MRNICKSYLLCASMLLPLSCAGDGIPLDFGDKPAKEAPPDSADANPNDPEPVTAITTSTVLQKIDGGEPAGKLCYDHGDFAALPQVNSAITADADLQEWPDEYFMISDPGGDSTEFDIHQVAAALVKTPSLAQLAIAVKGNDFSNWAAKGSKIHFKFGSLLKDENSGTTRFTQLREYRYSQTNGLERKVDASYQPVPGTNYQMKIADSGLFEFLLAKSELDEVLLQPLWSLEVEVSNNTNGDVEKTGRFFYKNILAYPTGFKTYLCALRMGSHAVTVQEIIDESLLVADEDSFDAGQDSDQKLKNINTLLSIVRESFESAWFLLGKPIMQHSHFTVVFTEGQAAEAATEILGSQLLTVFMSETTKLNPYFKKTVYEQAGDYLIRQFIDYQLPYSRPYLQLLVSDMLSEQVHKQKLGVKFWLESYQSKTNAFAALHDSDEPIGLLEWDQRQENGALTDDALQYFAAKVNSLALILNRILPSNTLLAALRTLKQDVSHLGQEVTHERLFAEVDTVLSGTFADKVSPYNAGWIQSTSYLQDYAPFLLSDEDLDGLPRFYETSIGINPGREDTDSDGWTDLAEIYALSDPKSASSRPNGLMADGSFGDWQELLPDQVINDNGSNSAGCPAAADISHHIGLYDHGRLVIAAAGKDLWAEPPYVRWEVQISVKGGLKSQLFTLRTVKNRYYYDVLEGPERNVVLRYPSAKPLGIDSMEWYIDLQAVGVDTSLLTEENFNLSYRISTLYEDDQRLLCDDTVWTQPLFSTTEE